VVARLLVTSRHSSSDAPAGAGTRWFDRRFTLFPAADSDRLALSARTSAGAANEEPQAVRVTAFTRRAS